MYILTIGGPKVEAWLSRCKLPVKTRRIYRYNDEWGFLSEDKGYTSFKRIFITDSIVDDSVYNLERQEPSLNESPPLLCDDIWEEEYIEHTRGTCNGLLTVQGSLKDIQMWCRTAHISVPENLFLFCE
jgi:hypothetical protein